MKNDTLISLNDAWLCPGDERGPHITNNSVCCPCGNTNLASLARIMDREAMRPPDSEDLLVCEIENGYYGLMDDMPTLRKIHKM